MKKLIAILCCLMTLTACVKANAEPQSNFTDEMKLAYGQDISLEDGADAVERLGDHKASPYFTQLDFYNMESTDTLTILPHFRDDPAKLRMELRRCQRDDGSGLL